MKSIVPMLLLLAVSRSVKTNEETSDVYLRNVVEELQFLNGVVPSERSTRVSYPTYDDTPISETNIEASSSAKIANHHLPTQTLPRNPIHFTESPQQQQQSPQEQQRPPVALGFTAAELASMYRKALERGMPVKYNNPVSEYSFDRTKVTPALRVQHPGHGSNYAYYFYPLHTFRHELDKQNAYGGIPEGYHTLPDSAYAPTTIVDLNKKETSGNSIMNHIVTGVSSFIGMALFFVFSMFVYPRFFHMMHFPFITSSRTNFRNELNHLTAFVTEAIDAYNQNTRTKSKHLPQR